MPLSLILSVPDLQSARILAAAGVPQISLLQSNEHVSEIKSWLEGTKVGVQIKDIGKTFPQADFYIISEEYQSFGFIDTLTYWQGKDGELNDQNGNLLFLPYAIENEILASWLDWEIHYDVIEELFL